MISSVFRIVFGFDSGCYQVARRATLQSGALVLRARFLQRLVSMRPSSSALTLQLPPGLRRVAASGGRFNSEDITCDEHGGSRTRGYSTEAEGAGLGFRLVEQPFNKNTPV